MIFPKKKLPRKILFGKNNYYVFFGGDDGNRTHVQGHFSL